MSSARCGPVLGNTSVIYVPPSSLPRRQVKLSPGPPAYMAAGPLFVQSPKFLCCCLGLKRASRLCPIVQLEPDTRARLAGGPPNVRCRRTITHLPLARSTPAEATVRLRPPMTSEGRTRIDVVRCGRPSFTRCRRPRSGSLRSIILLCGLLLSASVCEESPTHGQP